MTVATSVPDESAASIVAFWRDAGPQRWFSKDAAFDQTLAERFHTLHLRAARRELDAWNQCAQGALALQILLDQVPRNIFRDTAHAWATDPLARSLALAAIAAGLDTQVEAALRPFCYMTLMHAEDPALQQRSVALFEALGGPSLQFAHEHRDIIQRFGRFPHRNRALGRSTTADEQQFLDAGGFAG